MNQPDIEAVFVDALQNIAEGVTELLGFEVAAISIARDDHTLEMVAVAGSPAARDQCWVAARRSRTSSGSSSRPRSGAICGSSRTNG